ncbi:MAG: hypothetical protein WCP15_03640 [bacterium]
MAYQSKYKKGFTTLELIIVIGIFVLLFSLSVTVYIGFTSKENRELAAGTLVEALRFAQSNSEAVNDDSKWGVKISTTSPTITVFKGSSYGTRDTTHDQLTTFSGRLTASGLTEIIFEKMNGDTFTTGTTTFTDSNGVKDVQINGKGTITY